MQWRWAMLAGTLACGRIDFDPTAGGTSPACTAYGPWGNLLRLAGATTDHETGPWLSPDGLDLWFARTVMGDLASTIWYTTRASTSDAFDLSTAVMAPFLPDPGTPDEITSVFLTDDQLQIYYVHFQSSSNVYEATRPTTSDPFANVNGLGFDNNGVLQCADATLTGDGLTLLYDTWDTGSMIDTVLLTRRATTADDFLTGVPIAGPTGANISGMSLSGDGSVLYWTDRPGGGDSILQWSTRIDATTYSAPTLVEGQPGSHDNIQPQLSRDGLTLMFASLYGDGNGYDIYQLTRSCQ
jgi:hypothetical protein